MDYKIKSKELRIGNIVHYTGSYESTVYAISKEDLLVLEKDGVYDKCRIDEISPVAITEEWLLIFGFKLKGTASYEKGDFAVQLSGEVSLTADDPFCAHEVHQKIKYVHQLQNLYFDLTGDELT